MNSNQKNDQQKQTAAKSSQQAQGQGQKKANSNIQQDTKKQQTDRTK